MYDREFRRHMEKYPSRSWGVILQQAWTMFLKDHVYSNTPNQSKNTGFSSSDNKSYVSRKLCFSFNEGHCKFSSGCKFEHKCGLCGKFGHGAFNCRKTKAITLNHGNHTKVSGTANWSDANQVEKNGHRQDKEK